MSSKLKNNNKFNLLQPEKAFKWAQQAAYEKNWTEAAQRWTVLRKSYPSHAATWIQGAKAHIKADEFVQAENLLNYARKNFPNNANTLIYSSVLAITMGEAINADIFLSQARDKFPDNLQVWMKSVDYAEYINDFKLAEKYIKKACNCKPKKPAPYIQCAELAMRAKKWELALENWKILRNHFPEVPAGYLRAAEAAHQLNQPQKAQNLIQEFHFGLEASSDSHSQEVAQQIKPQSKLRNTIELIWIKSLFNLQAEVNRNYLSFAWWLLEPLLYMVIYYVVFGLLLNRGGENYPVFLLTGLIPWMWFVKAISSSSDSIIKGQKLMIQVGLSPIIFPLVTLLQSTIKQLPVFLLLFIFIWSQGHEPSLSWISIFPVLFVQFLLTCAIACFTAAIIPFIRDFSYLVSTGLTFLMFLSGIFYDYQQIAKQWQELFLLNPMAFLIKSYREILINSQLPDFISLAWWCIGSIICCILLMLLYKRLRYIYPRIVME